MSFNEQMCVIRSRGTDEKNTIVRDISFNNVVIPLTILTFSIFSFFVRNNNLLTKKPFYSIYNYFQLLSYILDHFSMNTKIQKKTFIIFNLTYLQIKTPYIIITLL